MIYIIYFQSTPAPAQMVLSDDQPNFIIDPTSVLSKE